MPSIVHSCPAPLPLKSYPRSSKLELPRLQPGYAQRAAKYAAILAFFAIDPEPRNRLFALRTLRDYVVQRR